MCAGLWGGGRLDEVSASLDRRLNAAHRAQNNAWLEVRASAQKGETFQ